MDDRDGSCGAEPAHIKGRVIKANGCDGEMRKNEISDRRICAGEIGVCA